MEHEDDVLRFHNGCCYSLRLHILADGSASLLSLLTSNVPKYLPAGAEATLAKCPDAIVKACVFNSAGNCRRSVFDSVCIDDGVLRSTLQL